MKTASFFTYDGPGCISIALWAPRGMRHIPAYRALAPSHEMLQLTSADYLPRYRHILDQLNPDRVWIDLHQLVAPHEPVLLCWERPPFHRDHFCHRRFAAEWLERALHEPVLEYEVGSSSNQSAPILS